MRFIYTRGGRAEKLSWKRADEMPRTNYKFSELGDFALYMSIIEKEIFAHRMKSRE